MRARTLKKKKKKKKEEEEEEKEEEEEDQIWRRRKESRLIGKNSSIGKVYREWGGEAETGDK
jgi:hypothetical protein